MRSFTKRTLLIMCVLIGAATWGQTISTTPASFMPSCQGQQLEIDVPYTSTGIFAGDYYVQLSDAGGTFPNNITSNIVSEASLSSPISAILPSNLAAGSYRVRVVNDSPAVFSADDNGSDIVITDLPAPPVFLISDSTIGTGDIVMLSTTIQSSFSIGEENLVTISEGYDDQLAPNPFQDFYGGSKQQMIFQASELTALGMNPGEVINSITINLATVNTNYTLQNLVIKMGHSGIAEYTGPSAWITGLATVRNANDYIPVVNANTIAFDDSFVWDGSSNIIVEFSYSNNSFNIVGLNAAVYSGTPFASTLFFRNDMVAPADMENYSDDASFVLNKRTNVTFGVLAPVSTWAPVATLFTDAAATIPYVANTPAAVVYAKPSEDTIYYATLENVSGCSSVSDAEISVFNFWNGSVDTDWFNDANWSSDGVPQNTTKVLIPQTANQPVVSGAVTANAFSLALEAGAVLTIESGTTIQVENEIDVAPGAILSVEDNASLIQVNNVSNTGSATVYKNSNSLYKLDYTVWSSPVTGQNLQDFSPATLSNRFYTYGINGSGQEAFMSAAPSGNFTPGQGYLIRMPNELDAEDPNYDGYNTGDYALTFEGEFNGQLNNGPVQVALSTQANFYTMVGNPYPSPISVEAFFDANEDVLFNGQGIYFWRKRNNQTATSYAVLTTIAYAANDGGVESEEEPGSYTSGGQQWEDYFENLPSTWVIAPGQGFFVKGSGAAGNVIFTNNMRRTASAGQPFFRMDNDQAQLSRLWLNLNSDTNFSQTAVAYTADATLGVDYGKDARKFAGSSNISIYTVMDEDNFTIQARPAFDITDVVSLGYTAVTAGNYNITLHRKDGVFDAGQKVYLKDNLLGLTHNLEDAYLFASEEGTFDERFEIMYTNNILGSETPIAEANAVAVYTQDKILKVNTGAVEMQDVIVYDLRGRIIYSKSNINAADATLEGLSPQEQVLIVKVNTTHGAVNKKVLY